MRSKALYAVFAVLLLASMSLAACSPTPAPATEAPAAQQPTSAPAAAQPTSAPAAEQPTSAPAAPSAAFEPETVTNSTCGEGDFIKAITAVDENTVTFDLCRPDPAFLAKAAFGPFAIEPEEYLKSTGGGGEELLSHPIGTGPYMVDNWSRGDSITYKRFDGYWGDPALTGTAVLRWATESAARVLELQSGTVHEIENLGPSDFDTISSDPNLQLLPQDNPNTLYVGFTNTFSPWDNNDVRKAIAMGIDRQRIVDNFMPAGSSVATHFTPCEVPHGCDGEDWYAFDPEGAKALLAGAGYPDGFDTTIYYRDVFRGYLPTPGDVAVELQTQLKQNLNINATVQVMESGAFIDEASNGRLDGLYLLGWGADYMHITNFLDYHFGRNQMQFGTPYADIYDKLEQADTLADPGDLYAQANDAIKADVPMVPISHATVGYAALASLEGANIPPFGPPLLSYMKPADGDTVVYMQSAEPISMYCADETDGESLAACRQVLDGLLNYDVTGQAVPALATSWDVNEDATQYTFHLREGVTFHDGSTFDANDVVTSFAAALDVTSPFHKGNTGTFDYPATLFGFMND